MKTKIGFREKKYYVAFWGNDKGGKFELDFKDEDKFLVELRHSKLQRFFDAYDNSIKSSCSLLIRHQWWQQCPKCYGAGLVWFPPNMPVNDTYTGDGTPFKCDICKGKKIISIATGLPPE